MAIDQATAAFLAQAAEGGAPPIHELSPDEARAMGKVLTEFMGPGPDMHDVVDHRLDTTDGGSFDVRTLIPVERPRAVIVYLHGGGWVVGDIGQFDTLGRQLASRTGAAVVLVDYRKAPESPFPAAVDDAWQALQWADEHLDEIAGARVPLIVAGDSAGGNLATVLARRARDLGGPAVSLQVLVYPVTDCDLDTPSYLDPENQLLLDRDTMAWFWDHYVPTDRRRDPELSPLRAESLAGLPPAVVLTAEHDVLRSEGEAYADALAAAGVPVTRRRFDGQMHGFFTMVNLLPGSAAGVDYVVEQVSAHLDGLA